MTEKNIFADKLFLSLNISDFNLFLCENCNPPLSQQPPSKNLVKGSTTPLQKEGGDAHYEVGLLRSSDNQKRFIFSTAMPEATKVSSLVT